MRIVTSADLAALVVEAQDAPRKHKNLNLHPTLADPVQRLLNAFEPGTYVRPHRHNAPENGNSSPFSTGARWC